MLCQPIIPRRLAGEAFAGPLAAALFLASAQGSAAGFGGLTAGKGTEPVQWAQSESATPVPLQQGAGAAAPETGQRPPEGVSGQLIPLEIFINGARVGDWVLLDVKGALHAPIDAFEEWRVIRRSEVPGVVFRGQIWYPLWSVPGYEARLNPANQSLDLKFSPNAFATTRLTQDYAQRPPVTRPLTSVFLNYDLSYTQSDFNHGELTTKDLGALTELGLSGSLGVLTSSQLGRNLKDDPTLGSREWIRLETTFNRDFPDESVSLRIGDSTTRPGIWGRALYFGGVQLARNFALSPGFVTQPIPSLTGQATAPSTVELYINDTLRQTSQVPSGPFTIDNFPLLTGTGQARLVVKDILGRETTLVQTFFTSTNLLRQDLSDWSAEAGAARQNFGVESADYGERFGSGMYRYGINNSLTFETRGEASGRTFGAGVGLTAALPFQMLGQVAVAGSRDDTNGTGGLYQLGAEYASLRNGFTARTEAVTSDFRRVGQIDSTPSYRRQTLLSYTYFTRQFGQIGLAYARSDSYTTAPIRSYSANYTITLAARASLTFSVTRVDTQDSLADANAVGVNIVLPLDSRITAAGSATRRTGGTDFHVGASKAIGAERGEGWRALAGRRGGENYAEGGGYYQGSYGLVSADVMGSGIQSTARLGAQGGLIFVDGKAFASRRLLDSFALVEVPGYPDVGVGFQSAVMTRTDSDGKALVPYLLPYRQNTIRLDPNELPISAEIDDIEMATVPPARSAVKVTFAVRSGRGALIKILLDDGQPAPAGAELELVGDPKEFFVARRGEAFVTGLQANNVLRLKWNKQSCTLNVELPEGDKDEIARVGPVTCSGVKR